MDQLIELIQNLDGGNTMIRTAKRPISVHTVFLDEPIGNLQKYRDLIHLLNTAEEFDHFNLLISNPGGSLMSAMAIIEAIKNTDASVQAIINGECHSAASIIALNCHNILVTDSAMMMVHTASYGSDGSLTQVKSHVDFISKFIKRIIDSTYQGFLTPVELEDLHKGVEFWFDAKEIGRRLSNKIKSIENLKTDNKPLKKLSKTNSKPVNKESE